MKLYQTSCQRRVREEVMEGGDPPASPTENHVSVILNSANIVRTGLQRQRGEPALTSAPELCPKDFCPGNVKYRSPADVPQNLHTERFRERTSTWCVSEAYSRYPACV